MNRQKAMTLLVALILMGGTAGVLNWLRTHQRLGEPGIKAWPIADSKRMDIHLPETVLDYKSEVVNLDTNLYLYLPQDSSFAQRRYTGPDGFQLLLNAVMMGTDRTTIHKPEMCLPGGGWRLDPSKSRELSIAMQRPQPYQLPVMKLSTAREVMVNGERRQRNGVFIYWFVADNRLTARHSSRMLSLAWDLLRTGVMDRWAYIACFAECWPGEEEATFQRMQQFIQSSVPEFQLVPGPRNAGTAALQTASTEFR